MVARPVANRALILLLTALALSACGPPEPEEPPRLVVMVVVDQLRGDMLDRFDSLFTGGIRRIRDEGLSFPNATHDHAKTSTAVGHATLSTGVFPSRSGIIANEWQEAVGDRWQLVYGVEDTLSKLVDLPEYPGRSPKNLLRGGLADWVSEAYPEAIVLSVSRKDRAAIPMAGKTAGNVYWFVNEEGRFATSQFYRSEYPEWVSEFNAVDVPQFLGDSIWESTIPPGGEALARGDTFAFEGDGVHTTLPHRFEEEARARDPKAIYRWHADRTPYVDGATLAFAMKGMRELGVGQDTVLDFLSVSLSQTDAIGHDYGPISPEQLDNLLHLDRALGEFLSFLDDFVGVGNWVLGFSGDHGVMTMPEYLESIGEPGHRRTREERAAVRNLVSASSEWEGDEDTVARRLAAELETLPFVADAMARSELEGGEPADSFITLFRNSWHPERLIWPMHVAGVMIRYEEGFLPITERTTTSHGQPYYYDRHVPLVLMGPTVSPGVSTRSVRTVDLAPTLAWLAGVRAPGDLDGVSLLGPEGS